MQSLTIINSAADLHQLFNASEGLIVDIRNIEDYTKGHLPNALHMDLMSNKFVSYFSDLNKDENLLLYCTDGSRSKVALRILTEMGFQHLYNLKKGIEEWDGILS